MLRFVRPRGDQGIALVAAVGVVMLVTLLITTLIAYAIAETRMTGHDRQRSSAVMRAEGGVDTALSKMQGQSIAGLPCGTSSATNNEVARDTTTTVTTVTYYDDTRTTLACPLAAGAAISQALVKSTATVNSLAGQAPVKRAIESLVQVKPAPALNKAIFGDAGVESNKHLEVNGSEPGQTADVYSNDHVTCSGDGQYQGSLIVRGTITLGSCNVAGNAWATTGVTASSTSIGGVLVSAGSAALANSTSVTNTVRASGTIKAIGGGSWAGCSAPAKCAAGSTVTPPPTEEFPQLPYDTASWVAAGYNPAIVEKNTCNAGYADDAADWLSTTGATITQPTILHSTCPGGIYFKNNGDILLNSNVVVFASGGVSFKNSASFVSTVPSTMRYLYLIQPWGSVATPCTVDGIDMKNNLDVAPSVSTLLYTPCNVSMKNNTNFNGQIYAGGIVEAKMNLSVNYQPLPVYGVVNSNPTYNLDILYKRETR